MQLLLKDRPVLHIAESTGVCEILAFDFLPFALRKRTVSFVDFAEWAANRTLSIGRSYAKEILNTLRLSQTNRYAVCKACRGLSLEDSYWIRQDKDTACWEEVNLFQNPLTLFITEISLSGQNIYHKADAQTKKNIHTPELTTLGASAKGWIRQGEELFLHKVGKYEIPASMILDALGILHISYQVSTEEEISSYLSPERKLWIESVGDAVVNARLFTSEDVALVTFEEFRVFCDAYGLNPYEEAMRIDREAYLRMQIADYILNNNDRHEQNWGFLMDNDTGKIKGFCPLFDHDHAFCANQNVFSQTMEQEMTLKEAAILAQGEIRMNLQGLFSMDMPPFLTEEQWKRAQERAGELDW